MVMEKKLTFIGPTTGVGGVFHGAWWYYILTIPFILFGGLPIGFYWFNFFIHFISFILFAYFLNKYFGSLTSLLISLLVATSPYFIFTSLFVGNNIMVLPVLFLFLIIHLHLLSEKTEQKKPWLLFGVGLLLGLVAEFEFAFGLFLIPTYFLIIAFHRQLRSHFSTIRKTKYALVGFIIPFVPRILFELKNHFLQTTSFITALLHNNTQNPNSYAGALKDRFILIFDYYRSLFSSDLSLLFFTLLLAFVLYLAIEYKEIKFKKVFSFFLLLFIGLFLLSVTYKDNFFWGNYFEGIQYLYLLLIAFAISGQTKIHATLLNILKVALFCFILISSIITIANDTRKKPDIQGGLASQQQIVNYVISQEKNNNSYCVKIYTPPVIPYTYEYLFLYNKLSRRTVVPEKDWVRQQCWAIIEPDDFTARKDKWVYDNIPRVAHAVRQTVINGTTIVLYEKE